MDFEEHQQQLINLAKSKMPTHLSHLEWSPEQLHNHQNKALKRLLLHAKTNTAYYKKSLEKIDVDNLQLEDLHKAPITTKQDTLDYWDDFISNQIITRKEADDHLQKFQRGELSSPFYRENHLLFATGGSSGQRGLFLWEINDFSNFLCLAYRYQIRDSIRHNINIKKIAAIVAPSWLHASVPVFASNIIDGTETKHFHANIPIQQLAKELEAYQPDQLIGYASSIVQLSLLSQKGACDIKPSYICTNSEPLDQKGRASIFAAWGVKANNSWGSVESGMLAIEDMRHCGMWLTDDFAIIEPVDENLQSVQNPEDARKVLVTNLFNFAFPLIRYVLDDSVVITKNKDQTYRLAEDIQGRSDDWFCYANDLKIHPMTFRHVLGQENSIAEYQVIQTPEGADIFIVATKGVKTKELSTHLIDGLQKAGLSNPKINITQSDKLPRHAESGKLKRFISM